MPESMLRAMASSRGGTREAFEDHPRRSEFSAAQRLVDAAHLLSSETASIQLRYLQNAHGNGVEKNTTVVFPVPIDFLLRLQKLLASVPAPPTPAGS